ncbi:hypothetical protein [Deinococcus carri]|uniref:hypothetical protein n=1 Tax=Deinococcus carri TaxID=1211323 RepID=UPI0031E66674
MRLSVPGAGEVQQLLVIQTPSVNSAAEAFGALFYEHDPLSWALLCPKVTIREGVSQALLRAYFTPEAIQQFEARVAAGGCVAFSWEYADD